MSRRRGGIDETAMIRELHKIMPHAGGTHTGSLVMEKTLEILIPTYRRPAGAAQAIESCLANPTERLSVRCNSNGYQPELEKYRNHDVRLTYECFATNRGVHANFLHLLQSTTARFCMLLSDEDSIDPDGVPRFLDFLDQCPESTRVVTSSIFDLEANRFYFRADDRFAGLELDLAVVMALSLVPSYMSGCVFSVRRLAEVDLAALFTASPGNAYPHIDVAWHLLRGGYLRTYQPQFVLKGKDIQEGGDGYSHRTSCESRAAENLDLNPNIYGAHARARQFYYSECLRSGLRSSIGLVAYYTAQLCWFAFFTNTVLGAGKVVMADRRRPVEEPVRLALEEARLANEFSGTPFAHLFMPVVSLPRFWQRIVLKIVGKSVGILQVFAIKVVVKGYWNCQRSERPPDPASLSPLGRYQTHVAASDGVSAGSEPAPPAETLNPSRKASTSRDWGKATR